MNRKKLFDYNEAPPQIFSFQISEILISFLNGDFQSFLNMQSHFQSSNKVTNIALVDITLMSLIQYLDMFLSTLCAWRVRGSRLEEFYKKVSLKIPQNS